MVAERMVDAWPLGTDGLFWDRAIVRVPTRGLVVAMGVFFRGPVARCCLFFLTGAKWARAAIGIIEEAGVRRFVVPGLEGSAGAGQAETS